VKPKHIPQEAIENTQEDLKRLKALQTNFMNFYWDRHTKATPEQIAAACSVNIAFDQLIAKLEILKEQMK
jgi:hypothetical protein